MCYNSNTLTTLSSTISYYHIYVCYNLNTIVYMCYNSQSTTLKHASKTQHNSTKHIQKQAQTHSNHRAQHNFTKHIQKQAPTEHKSSTQLNLTAPQSTAIKSKHIQKHNSTQLTTPTEHSTILQNTYKRKHIQKHNSTQLTAHSQYHTKASAYKSTNAHYSAQKCRVNNVVNKTHVHQLKY